MIEIDEERCRYLGAIEVVLIRQGDEKQFSDKQKKAKTSVEIKIEDTVSKREFRAMRNATDGEINVCKISLKEEFLKEHRQKET